MSKISQLQTMPENDVSVYADYLPILDASSGTTKKISVNTLTGYTASTNPTATITSLCSSDYTIAVTARVLSGRLVYCEADINNGDTGIPASVPTAGSENLLTLPDSLFVLVLGMFEVLTLTEVPPTASYTIPALIPLNTVAPSGTGGRIKIQRHQGPWNDVTTMILSSAKLPSGNVKGLKLRFLALLKANVVLPYSS